MGCACRPMERWHIPPLCLWALAAFGIVELSIGNTLPQVAAQTFALCPDIDKEACVLRVPKWSDDVGEVLTFTKRVATKGTWRGSSWTEASLGPRRG